MTHHTRNPVTGRNGRKNVVSDMVPQDKRPAWNQGKTLNHVGTTPPPPKFTSRSASTKNPEQPKIVYVQAPPHQLLSEPIFVSQELPRSRTNFDYPPRSNAQPKVVYVQPSTTPRQPTIILQDPHRPKAYPFDYKPSEQPQIVYIQAPPVPQPQPPAPPPRQPVYHIQEPTQPPSQVPHWHQKSQQQQQPVIIYQEKSPPPSYRSNNEGVVRSHKYPEYYYNLNSPKTLRRRQCLTAVTVFAVLLALLALVLGLYFGITKSVADSERNAPQNRIAGGYTNGYYINGVYVVPVTSKPSNLYLILGVDTPCNGPGATQPNLPNCVDVTTAIVLGNWTTTTTTTPSPVTVLGSGAESSTAASCLLGLLITTLVTALFIKQTIISNGTF